MRAGQRHERGIAMAISLLFLLVVTIISVTAARNSSLSLKLSSNLQDQVNSLQSAEAALYGALALKETANDPFLPNITTVNPFETINPADMVDPNSIETIEVSLIALELPCPRGRAGSDDVWSIDKVSCDYFRIDSEHEVERRARTRTSLGVIKPVLL
ncbi:MAG: hypothetical protein Hals2KO_29810 [Halioglobus sp.]